MQEEIRKEQDKIRDNATIYDILKLEHKDVKKLFKQIVDEERFQENIYNQIKTALQLHMAGEEKLLYPRLENNAESKTITLESYEEHDVGRKIIQDIDDTSDTDAKFAKIKVLSEVIDMHVEEEEDELFKKAKRVLSDEDERMIAKEFLDEKVSAMQKM
jgi:hemerythrin-like domain-containing protein